MQWDGTELWVGELSADGRVLESRRIAASSRVSLFQPEWSPSGDLFVVSDRTGWWNLYRVGEDDLVPVAPKDAEFGVPQWVFGLSTYAFLHDGTIVCTFRKEGSHHLASVDPNSGEIIPLDLPYPCFAPSVSAEGSSVAFIAGGPVSPTEVVMLDFSSRSVEVLSQPKDPLQEARYLSEPERIAFPAAEGAAFAWFYPPRNADRAALPGELPPLIVSTHGGPTSEATQVLDMRTQFWTSRGFAYVDVNYGGSTGSGRDYRLRLNGRWGLVDVEDCVSAVRYLIGQGLVDPKRVAIRGGSAGGYTTLCALTFEPDVFAAGASYYGLADLVPFATGGTHKFESGYLVSMIGPWPGAEALYRERSPINFTEKLSRPMLVLQGSEDKVVPPAQSELMVKALEEKGLPHAYLLFEGEQHGFRAEENIARALEAELSFYGQVFGFDPPGVPRLELA